MTGIAISAVVHFLRMECLMQCLGNMVDVLDVSGTLLGGQLCDLAHVLLVGNDDTSPVALFLEKIYLGGRKFTDLDAECGYQITFHAICAILICHDVLLISG